MSNLENRLEQRFKAEFPAEHDFTQQKPLSKVQTATAAYLGTVEANRDLGLIKG